ncbi:MAG: sigma-70 family RNA polymerase sigma factor [Myxococcales bacterium]
MSDAKPSDQTLIDAAKAGDRKALGALLERYQGSVWRFGMKMCSDPEDAKEILQETLIAAARTLPGFRGNSAVSTWLYTIARSFCIKRRRKGKFEPTALESLEGDPVMEAARTVADDKLGPEEAVAGRQISDVLEEAISSLAPMYREVLILRDVEGLSAPEVGEVLGLSIEAVKSRLHRARIAVRERVAPALGTAEPPKPGCPDVLPLLSRHLEGELKPETCQEMEKHLATCPHCTSRCDSLKKTLAMCRTIPTPTVPKEIQDSVRVALEKLVASASSGR